MEFVRRKINESDYSMAYFHIGDLIPETKQLLSRQDYEIYFKENGSFFNRYKRYLKSNLGTKKAFGKMLNLLNSVDFISVKEADSLINWSETSKIIL